MNAVSYFKLKKIQKRPLRTCKTQHKCLVCGKDITCGQKYYDGNYENKVHEDCLKNGIKAYRMRYK